MQTAADRLRAFPAFAVWVAVVACAPGLLAQSPTNPHPPTQPSARFLRLFLEYRQGNADAAIAALSTWREADVRSEALPAPSDDAWTQVALVSFLTETGMRKGTFGKIGQTRSKFVVLSGWGLESIFEPYSYRAYLIVKNLTRFGRSHGDDRLLAFAARWYVMAVSYCSVQGCPARVGLQAMADHDLDDQAEIPLLVGAVNEGGDGPFVPTATIPCSDRMFDGPDRCVFRMDDINTSANPSPTREALWGFRTALKKDPTLVEAHLRYGHLLHMLNLNKDARPHLERALTDARAQHLDFLVYMASLFLGEMDEHASAFAFATAHFREAVTLDPTAHIANIALGDALLRSGDSSGWATARHMFDGESDQTPRKPDAWGYYRAAEYWRLASDLRDMRALARQTP